jgi:glycerol-3-phosphate dehydrogenase
VADIQVLLDEINKFIPSARLTQDDVEAAYSGARPLVSRPGKSASDLSRKYQILDHGKISDRPGLLSVLGGKYTTSRSMAQDVVDRVCKQLGKGGRCVTAQLPVGGGDIGIVSEYLDRQRANAQGLVDDACLEELVLSYGSAYVDVLDYVRREGRLGQRIAPDRPFILAQVDYALDHEMAQTVADVALRRTDAGNMGDRDGRVGQAIADEIALVRKLPEAEIKKQLAEYRDLLSIDPAPESAQLEQKAS